MKMKSLAVAVGGGVGGLDDFTMPDFNLADLQGETPEWLKWIADNKELVLGFFARACYFFKNNWPINANIWSRSRSIKSTGYWTNGMAVQLQQ